METEKNKARFLKAFREKRAIIADTCAAARIARSTFYAWRERDENFKRQVEEIEESQLDFVESKLLEKIEAGDTTAIIFYLKSKGKKRGWSDRETIETDVKIIGPLPPVDWGKKAFDIKVKELEKIRSDYENRTGERLYYPNEPNPIIAQSPRQ